MAPHPPKYKAGDLLRHREGGFYLFIVDIKGLSYDLVVIKEGLSVRQTATAKIIDWAYEPAT